MDNHLDFLLTNAHVLTFDDEFHIFNPGSVGIINDTIVVVGLTDQIDKAYTANETIDCQNKVLMPGLVNAHNHLSMNLLRGLADDLRLDVWLLGYMMPVERQFVSPDFVKLGASLACLESIRSGTTCVTDMYYFEDHVAQSVANAGLRAVCSQTVLKFPSPDAESYEEALDASRIFIQKWKGHPLIVPSIAAHAPYTCTDDILRQVTKTAIEFDVPLHTHIAETAQEVENSIKEHGMTVVPYLEKLSFFEAKVIAAHCVHLDESELYTLHQFNVGVAHNPTSNLKLASGVAPIKQMLNIGLNIGIGTDGAASNNDLDMFEEIRLAALLAKGISGDPTAVPAKTALTMATRMGAKAIFMDHLIGSLEPGKRADLILVNINTLHNSPSFHHDPNSIYSQLVYASKNSDVEDVMVNGKWLMRNHQLTILDEESLIAQANAFAKKIDKFLIEREKSVLSKLIAIGGASEAESFEVQAKVRIVDKNSVLESLNKPQIEILYHRHYHEYDTYFQFDDPNQGLLRHREDEFLSDDGKKANVRYRLTLIGPTREYHFPSDVLLSRSRFLAPAIHSLRFYKEYFNPSREIFVEKDRLRWRILFRGTEFYINLDQLIKPSLGLFLEVKSRTWGRKDAEHKASLAKELAEYLGANAQETVTQDYIEFILEQPTENQ
ncbi:MAG TPA: amidohydrolase family protein [Anaerolineae bacterium]|nr:amidohydrolase family protein [Anaerolineae bacterium]